MLESENTYLRKIESVAEQDGRYGCEAYLFIYAALEYTVQKLQRDRFETLKGRHVTGQELARSIADYAWREYGPMARAVFNHWGIHETLDFGRIVYNLIDAELMAKTDEDSLEDFRDVYAFDEMFSPRRNQDTPDDLDLERL